MSKLLVADDSNFKSLVLDSDVPVLVKFGATWCPPCKRQLPILEKLATEMGDTIKVVKVDVDDSPTEANNFKVKSIPALFLIKNGQVQSTKQGLSSLEDLKELVSKHQP